MTKRAGLYLGGTAVIVTAVVWLVLRVLPQSEIRIDGSTLEAMQTSIGKICRGMSAEDDRRFTQAVYAVGNGGEGIESLVDPQGAMRRILKRVDGKTAQDIWAELAAMQARAEEKRAARDLEDRKTARTQAQDSLDTRQQLLNSLVDMQKSYERIRPGSGTELDAKIHTATAELAAAQYRLDSLPK